MVRKYNTDEERLAAKRLSQQKFRDNNREKLRENGKLASKVYREKNKEIVKANRKISDKTYREKNKEKIKQSENFYYQNNKEYVLNRCKNYYKENIEQITEKSKVRSKIYRNNNKEKIKALAKKWKLENPDYTKNYVSNRSKIDEIFKFKRSVRNLILSSFKRKKIVKNEKSENILGCSLEEFKQYLESKFESWMNWENYGLYNGTPNYGWDIDHIRPLAKANTKEDVIELNHHTNLQPLCSYINRYVKKGV